MAIALKDKPGRKVYAARLNRRDRGERKSSVQNYDLTVAMIMYIFPPNYGGRAIQALQVAKSLQSLGVHSFFVAANLSDAPGYEIIDGSPVYRYRTVAKPRLDYLLYMLQVLSLLVRKRKTYDVIHFHSIKPFSFLITAAAKLLGKPTLISLSLIGNDDPQALRSKSFLWALEAKMYKRLDRINCESSALRNACLREGISSGKISSIPCGVDTAKFTPAQKLPVRRRLRKALGLPSNAFICLFVGRISTRKGCDLLFDAWRLILDKRGEGFFLVLVGPYGDHLFMKAEQQRFDQRVQEYARTEAQHKMKFAGQTDVRKTAQYFQAADCFVLPSKAEGFGIVTIEAMACGLPVIATRIEGVTEDIITHEQDGIILEDRDPAVLAQAIMKLKDDKERRSLLSENAVRKVEKRFTLSAVAAQHAALYEQLVLQKNETRMK